MKTADPGTKLQRETAKDFLRRLPDLLAATDAHAAEAARAGDKSEADLWLELRTSWSFLGERAEQVLEELGRPG